MHITGSGIPGGIVGAVRNQTEQDQQSDREKHESRDFVEPFGFGR